MASTLEQWEQDVVRIPYGEELPTAPLEGQEDLLYAVETDEEGTEFDFYLWGGTSFSVGVGPHPHPHAD